MSEIYQALKLSSNVKPDFKLTWFTEKSIYLERRGLTFIPAIRYWCTQLSFQLQLGERGMIDLR